MTSRYDRADTVPEVAAGLNAWAAHVEGLLTAKPVADVVPIRSPRRRAGSVEDGRPFSSIAPRRELRDNDSGGTLMGDVGGKTYRRRSVARRKARLGATRVLKRRAKIRFAKRSAKSIFIAKAGPKSRRHITAPATASQIAKSLGFTRNDVAQARALIDRLGL